MKKHLSLVFAALLLFNSTSAFSVGKIQNEDVKSLTDLTNAGGTASQLINDTKVYVTANGLNEQLSSAITSGAIGGGSGAGVQTLSNPGFEAGATGAPPASWTLTAATGTISTSTVYAGTNAELLTLSSQTPVLSQDVTPTQNFSNVNLEASCKVLTTQGTAEVCAREAGASLGSSYCTAVQSTGAWQYVPVNFVGPSSGSIGVEVTTTGSTTGTVYVDDCYVGPARNLSQVSQAQLIGGMSISGCSWSTTANSPTLLTTTGCTYTASGVLTAPSAMTPGFKITNAGQGSYLVVYSGYLPYSGSINTKAYWNLCSGSNSSCAGTGNPVAYSAVSATTVNAINSANANNSISTAEWNYVITTPGTTELDIYPWADASSNAAGVGETTVASASFLVYYFPSQSQVAVNSGAVPQSWSGASTATYNFANSSLTAGDATSITGTNTFTTLTSQGGMSCAATASEAGITCTNLPQGLYLVCPTVSMGTTGTGSGNVILNVTDGSNNLIIDPGFVSTSVANAQVASPMGCGTYNLTSPGSASFKLRAGYNGSVTLARAIVEETYSLMWTVVNLTAGMQMPLLAGSVTQNGKSIERIDSAIIGQTTAVSPLVSCTSSPCLVATQSGSWLTGIVRNSTGNYTLSIASGEFSAAPRCESWSARGSSVVCVPDYTSTVSSTQVTVDCFASATAAASDAGFGVKCMGPH